MRLFAREQLGHMYAHLSSVASRCPFVALLGGQAVTFSGRVVAVIDGDTIGVMRDGREVRIRLEGIDAAEDGQDFSQRAKQFTSAAVFGKTVDVTVKKPTATDAWWPASLQMIAT